MNGHRQRGSALIIVFIAIAVLAALTFTVSQFTEQQSQLPDKESMQLQVGKLFGQGAVLAGAMQTMAANGAVLPADLNTVRPTDGTWGAGSSTYKVYHPNGGGVQYMEATGPVGNSATVAQNFLISKGSIITGVGAGDTVGDVVFTATVNSAAACTRINTKLSGGTAPTMSNAAYTDLITNGTDTTINAGNCANCVNKSRACVVNVAGTGWGYYQVLFPQ
jgi:hypothetical protein